MNKSILQVLPIIAAITAAAFFVSIPLFRFLESHSHPLVMDITCTQSGNIQDFYWKINQVFVCRVDKSDLLKVQFTHSVPNFVSYYIKTAGSSSWKKLEEDTLSVSAQKKILSFFIKAANLFGAETSPVYYSIAIKDGQISITPRSECIGLHEIPFRFEHFTAPEMNFLLAQTLPVAGVNNDEWQKFLALRSWVKATIPFGNPRRDSNWNAAAILKEAHRNRDAVFLCDEHAAVFVSACVSAGLNARMIYLRSEAGNGHYAAEVWSDQQQRWIYMDPLYDFSYCENSACYSTLDLHNLYLKSRQNSSQHMTVSFPKKDYLNLFHEFQIIMANDFLSHPYQSVLDILSGRIPTLRWIDADTPQLNKWRAAGELLIYYYIPKVGRPLILVTGIFAVIIVMIVHTRKKRTGSIILQ
jgi:hypothetical protein